MNYLQIESKDVLSKIIAGATVYCVDISSERCMPCGTMTLAVIKSFVSNPEIIFIAEDNGKENIEETNEKKKRINGSFLIEGSDKEDTKETHEKKKRTNDSFFRKLKDNN